MSKNMPITTTTTTTKQTPQHNICRNSTKRSLSESSTDELQRNIEDDNNQQRILTPTRKDKLKPKTTEQRKMWRNELVLRSDNSAPQPQRKHNGNASGNDTNAGVPLNFNTFADVAVRVIMVIFFVKLEIMCAFNRLIQVDELWMYRFPRMPDIVTPQALFLSVILGPFIVTCLNLLITRDRRDFRSATLVWTLALCFNGITTSLLKITVGRPRPDFFYRCFPDGVMPMNNTSLYSIFDTHNCTGNPKDVNEGFKSFPSGHSSFAFCAFSFITYYVGAKLHAFSPMGRTQSWRLCIAYIPLVLAALVAISRTCDYHHHWQDVVVGSVIGLTVTYFVYRQYYPSVFSRYADQPYPHAHHLQYVPYKQSNRYTQQRTDGGDMDAAKTALSDKQPLLDSEDDDNEYFNNETMTTTDKRSSGFNTYDNKENNKWI